MKCVGWLAGTTKAGLTKPFSSKEPAGSELRRLNLIRGISSPPVHRSLTTSDTSIHTRAPGNDHRFYSAARAHFQSLRLHHVSTTMALNWQKLDAWRSHPLLNNTMKYSVPGIKAGFAAFAVYVVYDQTAGRMMRGNKPAAH